MFNRRFMDLVRHQLIKVLSAQARSAAVGQVEAPSPALRYGPDDVVAFVDLQNLFYFLKDNCRVPATQVHIPNLLRDFAQTHGLNLTEIQIFTGIHDYKREQHKHDAMAKRLRWLERNGCRVTALTLSYYTDRETKEVRAQEKGVDVRIGSEILRAVHDGLTKVILFTQDKDIAQATVVASEMSLERGRAFTAFSPELAGAEWEHNGKCGMHGLRGTERLPLSVEMAKRHVRPERPRIEGENPPPLPSEQAQGA